MAKTAKISTEEFIELFNSFPKTQRAKLAKTLYEATFNEQWKELDKKLPDVEMSAEEIMKEVKAVRYAKKKS